MPFILDIEEVFLIRGKGMAILTGKLLEGELCLNHLIGVPTLEHGIVPRPMVSLEANHKVVDKVRAGEAEQVGVMVMNCYSSKYSVEIGRATDFDKENYAEMRRAEQAKVECQPKSPWWMF